ncbi:hypothetical protein ACFFX1_49345 [Dactylosporangium sucinum]|uniref:Uncharacterized protein n=1 Tax=Dactylosporangium sucinum TaxID=1424081 RepID=A0A917UHW9_9ACTN|nr:hypothetical protein [Dactylosporangium sucinum]GGM90055.1 hypothetical protein GCM10007977_110150 [Dactylosporangium sucinum]
MNQSDPAGSLAVSPAVVTPALDRLRGHLDAFHRAPDGAAAGDAAVAAVAAAQALLDALTLRTYPAEPGTDDRGEQVVISVYGVDLSIRRRADGVFVHVDSVDMPADLLPLIGEFNNGGENVYAEADDDPAGLR